MASRRIEDLAAPMQKRAQRVVELCAERGVDVLIYCTLRTLDEQAVLYRQSRPWAEIAEKMARLRSGAFGFLADAIERVGPQSGPHVTNAAPGESFHAYGEAFDAVPLVDGKLAWNVEKYGDLWHEYGAVVKRVGLYWAGDWDLFREYPHAQYRLGGNPLRLFSPTVVQETLIRAGKQGG